MDTKKEWLECYRELRTLLGRIKCEVAPHSNGADIEKDAQRPPVETTIDHSVFQSRLQREISCALGKLKWMAGVIGKKLMVYFRSFDRSIE